MQILAYTFYLTSCFFSIIVVGKHLHKNGEDFLFQECQNKALSKSTNNLLFFAYCLLNIGGAFFHLNTNLTISTLQQFVEFIGNSLGELYLFLGVLHLFNLIIVPRVLKHITLKLIIN